MSARGSRCDSQQFSRCAHTTNRAVATIRSRRRDCLPLQEMVKHHSSNVEGAHALPANSETQDHCTDDWDGDFGSVDRINTTATSSSLLHHNAGAASRPSVNSHAGRRITLHRTSSHHNTHLLSQHPLDDLAPYFAFLTLRKLRTTICGHICAGQYYLSTCTEHIPCTSGIRIDGSLPSLTSCSSRLDATVPNFIAVTMDKSADQTSSSSYSIHSVQDAASVPQSLE
ncbi:hypothetical protein EGR_03142 [Echinococcus granulosus]|uniref:Uncharacterized protein n=1 Tax=Echinococcus granulosus TaxID=6210 RepID=W6ULV9_ECHGR|nr:hypothetical protein EGR_03142 [Echinococcus granulosus]EUB62121.1 hypothetical protein EGR_03142 [Echinococcus granulosus]